ncbi:hypothetical protein AC1031_010693 [Aphanomyces cochlioides]|nr:hypothetical protein AC1031_010693 [Aphanomyces cochlioides]
MLAAKRDKVDRVGEATSSAISPRRIVNAGRTLSPIYVSTEELLYAGHTIILYGEYKTYVVRRLNWFGFSSALPPPRISFYAVAVCVFRFTKNFAMDLSDLICKYAYKQCSNPRSIKRDGDLHRLCAYHREKANALQKAYATKRRRELREQKKEDWSYDIEPMPYHVVLSTSSIGESDFDSIEPTDLNCLFDDLDSPIVVAVPAMSDGLTDEQFQCETAHHVC